MDCNLTPLILHFDLSMIVGTLRLSILIRGSRSLKEKRQVVKSLKDRIRNKFNVSVAETDFQDVWQRAELGVSAVGTDAKFVSSVLSSVVDFVRMHREAELADFETEIF